MQLHGPTKVIHRIGVQGYGTSGARALVLPSDVTLVLEEPGDADEVIRAAAEAKRQMLAEREAGPAWCPAVLDDAETLETFYCDRERGHPGSHRAPGPDEGSEVAWSSCEAVSDVFTECTAGAGATPHRDRNGYEWIGEDPLGDARATEHDGSRM